MVEAIKYKENEHVVNAFVCAFSTKYDWGY